VAEREQVLPERSVEDGCPMLDVGTSCTLHPCGLGVLEPCIDRRLKFLDLRGRRIELFDQSFLSSKVCGCANDLFANRPDRSRNIFER
jgi:hypothetical protein